MFNICKLCESENHDISALCKQKTFTDYKYTEAINILTYTPHHNTLQEAFQNLVKNLIMNSPPPPGFSQSLFNDMASANLLQPSSSSSAPPQAAHQLSSMFQDALDSSSDEEELLVSGVVHQPHVQQAVKPNVKHFVNNNNRQAQQQATRQQAPRQQQPSNNSPWGQQQPASATPPTMNHQQQYPMPGNNSSNPPHPVQHQQFASYPRPNDKNILQYPMPNQPQAFPMPVQQPQYPMPVRQEHRDPRDQRFTDTKRMKHYELKKLVGMQHKGMSSGNPFNDDYYFVRMQEKKALLPSHTSMQQRNLPISNEERPAEILHMLKAIHTGESEDTKQKILEMESQLGQLLPELASSSAMQGRRLYMEHRQADLAQKTAQWQSENQVLGKMAKSNLRTPKTLIDTGGGLATSSTFSNDTWQIRKHIAALADAVLEIEDVHRLLKAKATGVMQHLSSENIQTALSELEQVQYLRCAKVAGLLGVDEEGGIDDLHVRRLVWLPKGRAMVCRSVASLLEKQLHVFLLCVFRLLAYFVCTGPDQKASPDNFALDMIGKTGLF